MLTQEDYSYAKVILDNSIRLDYQSFDSYLKMTLDDYVKDIDMNILTERMRVQSFFSHLSTLYLNIMLNGVQIYLLSEKEVDIAHRGRIIICDKLEELRKISIK